MHVAAAFLFLAAMLFHSHTFFVLSVVLAGAGFLNLHLPEIKEGRMQRIIRAGIAAEKRLGAMAPGWRKRGLGGGVMFGFILIAIALWTRALLLIAALIGVGVLVWVAYDNRRYGIR